MKNTLYICFSSVLICCLLSFSSICAQELTGREPPTKLFQEQGAGYVIEYPYGWTYVKSGITVVFSGLSGTKAYFSTVSIQNLLSTKAKAGKYQDVDAVIGDFLNQLKTAKEFKRSNIEPFPYSKGSVHLMGKQFVGEYWRDGERFRQWIIVLPRPKGEAFHAWFYTSPITQYDEFLGTAKIMLNSWIIVE
ncbi:MAG: hypothetical protein NTX75_06695 [Proteobacteria bacterium]|nr:hypothetical protein [Pseudomonadota bacterium]